MTLQPNTKRYELLKAFFHATKPDRIAGVIHAVYGYSQTDAFYSACYRVAREMRAAGWIVKVGSKFRITVFGREKFREANRAHIIAAHQGNRTTSAPTFVPLSLDEIKRRADKYRANMAYDFGIPVDDITINIKF